jgi:hypothetical protein
VIRELTPLLIIRVDRFLKLEYRVKLSSLRHLRWIKDILEQPDKAIHLMLVDFILIIASIPSAIFLCPIIRMSTLVLIIWILFIDQWLPFGLG